MDWKEKRPGRDDGPMRRRLLWWGRFDPDYSRNGVLRGLLRGMGWALSDFHPLLSSLGDVEAALRRLPPPDAVWLPCFRQRDAAAAARWCRRRRIPLLFDPLISAYDKQVFERGKFPAGSRPAAALLRRERRIFSLPDRVLADTPCHAAFFRDVLGVPEEKIRVVYVGADETLFRPAPPEARPAGAPAEILFYGSFIPLHGAETIVEAARIYRGPPARWHLLGDGPARPRCRELAAGLPQTVFERPVPYGRLCERIHRADILLGVFGATPKAGRVMPNKLFQALAAGRPVITRESDAYPPEARRSPALRFVPPGDAPALAAAAAEWAEDRRALGARAAAARPLYDACLSSRIIRAQLRAALDGAAGQKPDCPAEP